MAFLFEHKAAFTGQACLVWCLCIAFVLLFSGCGRPQPEPDGSVIRVARLKHISAEDYGAVQYPGLAPEYFESVAEDFVARLDRTPEWVLVDTEVELLAALRDRRAELAIGLMPVHLSEGGEIAFATPLSSFPEWVVGRSLDGTFGAIAGSFAEAAIKKHYPDSLYVAIPASSYPVEVADAIAAGRFDATVMHEPLASCFVADYESSNARSCRLKFDASLSHLNTLTRRNFSWAVHSDNQALLRQLNPFLGEHLLLSRSSQSKRSWEEIKEAGHLRMLTRTGPTTYYLWKGEQVGFEYELLKLFAESHDLDLDVVVGTRFQELEQWLTEGSGDLISASYTNLASRQSPGFKFSNRYMQTNETVVSAYPPVESLLDLVGRTALVNPETSYYQTLQELRTQAAFLLDERPYADTQSLIDEAIATRNTFTLADQHLVDTITPVDNRVAVGLAIREAQELVWVLRDDQDELRAQLNAWIKKNYRGLNYNLLQTRYFRNIAPMPTRPDFSTDSEQLSEFDELVKPVAEEFGFDWRLIVSMIYQESEFNPRASSFAGARGLMQLLPRTANEFGYDADMLYDPATNIRAGVEYLAWVRDRFPDLAPGTKTWFALAGYNAGVGHVRDARRVARSLGDDPNEWFGHVENAILKLAQRQYYSQATYGYVRGREPYNYVRDIQDRFEAYVTYLNLLQTPPAAPNSVVTQAADK